MVGETQTSRHEPGVVVEGQSHQSEPRDVRVIYRERRKGRTYEERERQDGGRERERENKRGGQSEIDNESM